MRPEGLCQWKNSSDTIGNRTRDLPAFSAVPQLTAPPRAPLCKVSSCNLKDGTQNLEEETAAFFSLRFTLLMVLSRYLSRYLIFHCISYCIYRAHDWILRYWLRFFPCFFLSCKADARIKQPKTGHGLHCSKSLCCCMYCLFCVVLCIVCVYMCTVLLPPGGYPITVKYIIYRIIAYHIYHIYHIYHRIIYRTISYHISYHISSYHISYHIITYIIIYIIPYNIIYITSYHIISYTRLQCTPVCTFQRQVHSLSVGQTRHSNVLIT